MNVRKPIVPILSLMLVAVLAGGEIFAGKASRSRGGSGGSKGSTASRGGGGGGSSASRSASRGARSGGRSATRAGRGSSAVRTAAGQATWRHWGRGGRGVIYRPHRPLWGGWGWGGLGWGGWNGWGWGGPGWGPNAFWWGRPGWSLGWGLWSLGYYDDGRDYDDGRETVRVQGNLPSVIETDVRPRRATVTLNGVDVGRARDYNGTWDELDVGVGQHVIEFTYRGYKTLRYHVTVEPGQRLVIYERLEKGDGLDPRSTTGHTRVVRPSRPAPASGPTPSMRTEVGTPAAAVPAPREEPREEVRDDAGLRRGLLRLEVSPADAAIYLDGEFLARADELSRLHGALPVATGIHTIEVVRPGYDSRTIEFEVEEGDPTEVTVRLERR